MPARKGKNEFVWDLVLSLQKDVSLRRDLLQTSGQPGVPLMSNVVTEEEINAGIKTQVD